jgi:hypothetical protein
MDCSSNCAGIELRENWQCEQEAEQAQNGGEAQYSY